MKTNIKYLTLFAGCLTCATAAPSGPVDYARPAGSTFSAKSGNWSDASNWDKKQVPKGFVNAMIPGGRSVTISGPLEVTGGIFLGSESDRAPAKLFITEGARVVAESVGLRDVMTGARGDVRMTGGSLELGARGFCIGKGTTYSGAISVEISGGKVRGKLWVGCNADGSNEGVLRVMGSLPDISNGQGPKDDIILQKSGTIEFVLDEKGVASLNFKARQALFTKEGGGKIRVNGGAYRGGSQKIPLIVVGKVQGKPPVVEIVNFSEKYRVQAEWEKRNGENLILKISETNN